MVSAPRGHYPNAILATRCLAPVNSGHNIQIACIFPDFNQYWKLQTNGHVGRNADSSVFFYGVVLGMDDIRFSDTLLVDFFEIG